MRVGAGSGFATNSALYDDSPSNRSRGGEWPTGAAARGSPFLPTNSDWYVDWPSNGSTTCGAGGRAGVCPRNLLNVIFLNTFRFIGRCAVGMVGSIPIPMGTILALESLKFGGVTAGNHFGAL